MANAARQTKGDMMMADNNTTAARQMVAAADSGGRSLGGGVGRAFAVIAIAWTLFQLWAASPLPFYFSRYIPVLNLDDVKIMHLSFALLLVFAAYPARKSSPRNRIPVYDWTLTIAAPLAALYLLVFKEDLAGRAGAPILADLVFAGFGMALLLEAARRALGLPLVVVAVCFLLYVFFGDSAFLPDAMRWKGASFQKAMSHFWLSTEGKTAGRRSLPKRRHIPHQKRRHAINQLSAFNRWLFRRPAH